MGTYSYRIESGSLNKVSYYSLFEIAYKEIYEYSQQEIATVKQELERRAAKFKVIFNDGRPISGFLTLCLISNIENNIPSKFGIDLALTNEMKLNFYYIDERSNVILQNILSSYGPFVYYQQILAVSEHVHKEASYLLDALKNSIDKSFQLN